MTACYTLNDINNILFQGFDFKLPEETLKIISELALQVGSPDYVKTPVFQKRENPMKVEPSHDYYGPGDGSTGRSSNSIPFKKSKRNKAQEIVNDEDWEALRTFQTTKIEEKVGFEAQIDAIRAILNKLSDKNYIDMRNKIIDLIDKLVEDNITLENMERLSSAIFEIASTNRFYSKLYADLYSDLSSKYETMKSTFENKLTEFIGLFTTIEYVDPKVDYDRFCEINKTNEKRKSLATFYLNLMHNGIIPQKTIMLITRSLLAQVYAFISEEDKKNEVDELTETIAILYKKELYEDDDADDYLPIEGFTISEVVEKIANSKVKDYKSLTNKTLFKFMDLIDM
jgi:hypothetical protein